MKKPFKFDELSDLKCSRGYGCPTRIKKNVLARKENHHGLMCAKHHREREELKGHEMSTAREVRQGKKPGKKYRETIAETKKRELIEKNKK